MPAKPKPQTEIQQRYFELDKNIKKSSWDTFQALLAIYMKDYPTEDVSTVTTLIHARDYIGLIRWADSRAQVEHTRPFDAFEASQLAALIKKYPFPDKALKPLARAKAAEKFFAAEARCRRYNLRFRRLNNGGWSPMHRRLEEMRSWIRYVLGDKPDMASIYGLCSFGPGASVGVNGQSTNIARKFLSDEWTVTPLALPYALTALAHVPLVWELLQSPDERFVCWDVETFSERARHKVRLVHNNNITFVPKTTMVDRTIAIEPLLNGYLQKGIDLEMRSKLRRVGINLNSQLRNQAYAWEGSLPSQSDPFCTIDLSAASDTISADLVKYLLPSEWFDLLNHTRSGGYELDGESRLYEKFTSMGNGFCFPLETLIFASVCAIYSDPSDFTVYGDDIIVRRSVFDDVIKTLRYLGFRENRDKTFNTGPFRESCGADWHCGINVRPLTLDFALDSTEQIIKFHNSSLRHPLWVDRFADVRKYLIDLVPLHSRLVRPYLGQIETAFEVDLDVFMTSPFSKWSRKGSAWSWLESVRRSAPDQQVHKHGRYHIVLEMAALLGSPSSCPFAVRRKTIRTFRRISYSSTSLWLPNDDYNTKGAPLLSEGPPTRNYFATWVLSRLLHNAGL